MNPISLKAGKRRSSLAVANNELAEILTSYRQSLVLAAESGSAVMQYSTKHGYGNRYYNAEEIADRINLVNSMIEEL